MNIYDEIFQSMTVCSRKEVYLVNIFLSKIVLCSGDVTLKAEL